MIPPFLTRGWGRHRASHPIDKVVGSTPSEGCHRVEAAVHLILRRAINHDGFYDGTLDELPWSFWLQELTIPEEDVSRMLRIWNGEYLGYRRYGSAPCLRQLYTFRDRDGRLGSISISDNMGFQYFRWFRDSDHLKTEFRKLGEPAQYQRGLPEAEEVLQLKLSNDRSQDIVAAARRIAAAYLTGEDCRDGIVELILTYQQILNEEKSSNR